MSNDKHKWQCNCEVCEAVRAKKRQAELLKTLKEIGSYKKPVAETQTR